MNLPDLWVLSCAPGSRAGEAYELFDSFDSSFGVLVTTDPDPIRPEDFPDVSVLHYEGTDINISKWWTLGLDFISDSYYGQPDAKWDVLIIETDARMDPKQVERLRTTMRYFDAVMAGGDWRHVLGSEEVAKVRRDNSSWVPDPNMPDAGRVPGIACVVAGETGIRHDPEFRWWLADDDFEWQHRINGGTLLLQGVEVFHVGTQGPLTGERLQAYREDEPKFLAKWGGLPGTGGIL